MTDKTTIPYERSAICDAFGLDTETVHIGFDKIDISENGELSVIGLWESAPKRHTHGFNVVQGFESVLFLRQTRYRIDPATLPDWKYSVLSPPPKAPTEFAAGQIWRTRNGCPVFILRDGAMVGSSSEHHATVLSDTWHKLSPAGMTYIGEHRYHIDGLPLPEGVEL